MLTFFILLFIDLNIINLSSLSCLDISRNVRPTFQNNNSFLFSTVKKFKSKTIQVMYLKNFGFYQDNIPYLHFMKFYTCKNVCNETVFIKQLY